MTSTGESNLNLTREQLEILEFVRKGHNLVITGQAGVGKSRVVRAIREDCSKRNLRVGVICSTGISCTVYETGTASTVHSFYGFGVADLPSELVVTRSVANYSVRESVGNLDVIIWDEASMSSARMLELVNAVHHCLVEPDSADFMCAFAGKQVIIVGEFLQLPPVPNRFDAGDFMFKSPVFIHAIPHRFALTKLMRQSELDKPFVYAIADVRLGMCSLETAAFIASLSRDLEPNDAEKATHVFYKRDAMLIHNKLALQNIPGGLLKFEATVDGSAAEGMRWPGERQLVLKKGCKVMLIWNKSDALKNGSMGVFLGIKDQAGDSLEVCFEGVGTVSLGRETWIKRNRAGEKSGSITQFPIVLAYAVTCHKSQALTLPAVVVHCSKEFVPGLLYVAMSRVTSAQTLQVLNFKESQLLQADQDAVAHSSQAGISNTDPSLNCCRKKPVTNAAFFEARDRFEPEEPEDEYRFPVDVTSEGMLNAYFERENSETPISFEQIFDQMEQHESELANAPLQTWDFLADISALKEEKEHSEFSRQKNVALDMLLTTQQKDKVHAFVNLVWFHVFLAMEKHIVENPDDFLVNITRSQFTTVTAKLHSSLSSEEFTVYLRCLFTTTTCTQAQRSIGFHLVKMIYFKFLSHVENVAVNLHRQEAVADFDVEEMSAAGRAKVRHVGGWVLRKILEKSRSYLRANIHTDNAETSRSVMEHHKICELIEESLIASFDKLEKESNFKETLQVTEARQFRERGLIHIEDSAYKFFMSLERLRVNI